MFNIFKNKKSKQPEITIDYIEDKYDVELTFPIQSIPVDWNLEDPFYDEFRRFGCSDIVQISGTTLIHRDCWKSSKYKIDVKSEKIEKTDDVGCPNCNYYPILKRLKDIKRIRKKKLNKIKENSEQNPE
jgi:DNA-directed RNA polymerase subunit RPC12/RpoP